VGLETLHVWSYARYLYRSFRSEAHIPFLGCLLAAQKNCVEYFYWKIYFYPWINVTSAGIPRINDILPDRGKYAEKNIAD